MLRSQAARSVARRAFSTEVKEISTASTPAPVKSGSSFGQRLLSFTVGFGVAAGIGLYQLTEDVEKSTAEIQTAISALKSDVIAQNAALTMRIEQLEKRK
ncbi:hypothetical protein Poli38472_008801 [Pythium oligandrum]|uniref:Uncharacterized protein n=1 Tax=Pythium oligandrum TaxID=41045 RepID=A0A8K1C4F9_PYTOL|nr:hypothetical protein Poli38472_008801 [Pythium oligandrum]|eukprot:TMW56153.1 hypothetical protein Poli38472_008801 [Pythium oligandrum]